MVGEVRFNKLLGFIISGVSMLILVAFMLTFGISKLSFASKLKKDGHLRSLNYVEKLRSGNLSDEELIEVNGIDYVAVLFLQDSIESRKVYNTMSKIDEKDFKFFVIDYRDKNKRELRQLGLMSPVHYLALGRDENKFEPLFNAYSNKPSGKIYEDVKYVDTFGLPYQPFPNTIVLDDMGESTHFSYTSVSSKVVSEENRVELTIDMFSFTQDSSYSIDPQKFTLKDKVSGVIYENKGDVEYINIVAGGTQFSMTYTLKFEIPNTVIATELSYNSGEGVKMHLRIPYLEIKDVPKRIMNKVELFDGEQLLETFEYKKDSTIERSKKFDMIDKEGYRFAGWYLDKDFEDKLRFADENNPTMVESDVKLYAKWEKLVMVEFIVGAGMDDLNFEVVVGSNININNIKIENEDKSLVIEGYYLDEDFENRWDPINDRFEENITLYIKWKEKEA